MALAAKALTSAQRQAVLAGAASTPAEVRNRVSRIISQFPAQHAALTASITQGTPLTHWTAGLADATLVPVITILI